jgi:DNA-binding PadR family transcriptional regulator
MSILDSNLDETTTSKPRKRLFEAGQMKLLVLYFISQEPKFSYDIIKDVANLVGGNYKPSTGTICPTINYLEEQQFTTSVINADDRKQYHITSQGQEFLNSQQDELKQLIARFDARKQILQDQQYVDIKRAMENLKASLRLKILHCELSPEKIEEIAEKIDQAAVEIARL